jgi:hypothetical protein
MQDFLDKLDDELSNMQPKKEETKNTSQVVITSVSNTKTENTKTSYSNNNNNKKTSSVERKTTNRFYNKNSKTSKFEHREKFISKFPETRFYLPSLRDKHTRYIPIG